MLVHRILWGILIQHQIEISGSLIGGIVPPFCSTHSFLVKGTSPISSNIFIGFKIKLLLLNVLQTVHADKCNDCFIPLESIDFTIYIQRCSIEYTLGLAASTTEIASPALLAIF